ncbi:hypothetical protein Calag_0659 [Caldisphaera lagunensis DSM 15908]|uniref:Uncharacterized protein n=1 Tax=Caldisphaera lagunensis (strain DSM 15908 / JCM 11604 / ANMR 0165 / IC-154) TaxID=1056495 RepID=L0ABI3_CALLD|nr:hypothetical protein [Caldisphaera lagunensis]AFZ70410.1 hypothetical protein Calag_0659 [Caldisphaera lagunensis DSM 15908]
MLSKGDLSLCPNLIAVSLPNKKSWAFEEISDTIFEKDPNAYILESKYNGVFLIYLKENNIDAIMKNVLAYQHAFLSRIVPVKSCGNDLKYVIENSLLILPKGFIKLIVHLREPLKNVIKENEISDLIISYGYKLTKKSSNALILESIDEIFVSTSGIIRKCGPSCITVY